MHQLVQSALDAANQGDKMKAFELIQRALSTNPRDVDALFVLANLAEDPTHKRQALNRILSVEPTHKAAREMMLQMDRAEIIEL
jgi:cytochrome c-type biogenesis protein CcmH/NrfG